MNFRKFFEQQTSETFYWVAAQAIANPSLTVPIGFRVPAWTPRDPGMEAKIEEIRVKKYPQMVSRINPPCTFLAPNVKSAKEWVHHLKPSSNSLAKGAAPIYMVRCDGDAVVLDGDVITSITQNGENYANFETEVDYYWLGLNRHGQKKQLAPEVLCRGGAATVVQKMEEDNQPFQVGDKVIEKYLYRKIIKMPEEEKQEFIRQNTLTVYAQLKSELSLQKQNGGFTTQQPTNLIGVEDL